MNSATGSSVCDECGKKGEDNLRCSRCQNAWYCGPECQRKAWKSGHKKACKSDSSNKPNGSKAIQQDPEVERKENLMVEKFNEGKKKVGRGEKQAALGAFELSLKLSRELEPEIPEKLYGFKMVEAKCLRNIGNIFIERDENQAQIYLEAAVAVIEELKAMKDELKHPELPLDEAETYDHLGALAMLQGNILKALACYSHSLGIMEKGRYTPGMVMGYGNLGLVLYQLNRYTQAQEMFNKQIAVAQTNGQFVKYLASALNNSGIVDIHENRIGDAMGKFIQALIYARTCKDKEQERTSLVNIINNNQDAEKAAVYLQNLTRIQEEIYNQPPQSNCFQCNDQLTSKVVHVVPNCLHYFHRDCWVGWRDSQPESVSDLCPKCALETGVSCS
mmetsp:Transcript_23497/g.30713  ORF Transcript_23497/g.30713 Transcript_23497/m.30713 type:complete len:389 (+) Transcript_23497:39-1205(+)